MAWYDMALLSHNMAGFVRCFCADTANTVFLDMLWCWCCIGYNIYCIVRSGKSPLFSSPSHCVIDIRIVIELVGLGLVLVRYSIEDNVL